MAAFRDYLRSGKARTYYSTALHRDMWFHVLCALLGLAGATTNGGSLASQSGVQYINERTASQYGVVYDEAPRLAYPGNQGKLLDESKKFPQYAYQAQDQRAYLNPVAIQANSFSLQLQANQALGSAETTSKHHHVPVFPQRAPAVAVMSGQSAGLYSQGQLPAYVASPQAVPQGVASGQGVFDYYRGGATYSPTSDSAHYATALQNYAQQLGYQAAMSQNQGYPTETSAGDTQQYIQQAYYVPSLPKYSYPVPSVPQQTDAGQIGGSQHPQPPVQTNGGYAPETPAAQPPENTLVYPPRYSSGATNVPKPTYAGTDGSTAPNTVNDLNVPSEYYTKDRIPTQVAPIGAAQGLYRHPYKLPVTYIPYRYPFQPAGQVAPAYASPSPAQSPHSVPVANYAAYVQPHTPSVRLQPYYPQQGPYASQAPTQPNQEQFVYGGPTRAIYTLPGPVVTATPSTSPQVPQHHQLAVLKQPVHPQVPSGAQGEQPVYGRSFGDIGYTAASIYGTPMYSKASPNPFLSKYVNAPHPYFPKGVVSDAAGNVYIQGPPRSLPRFHPAHVPASAAGQYAASQAQYEMSRFITMQAGKNGVTYIKKK
ncbi:uncharacterized protein LOC144153915 [Haemaphysalis longicornis]